MPKTMKPPSYRLHRPSGRAVVTLGAKTHYLGPYGGKTSRNEYDRLVGEWLANGRRLADAEAEPLLVNEVLAGYYGYCKVYYANRRSVKKALSRIRCALGAVKRLFGKTLATTFGPRALIAVRQQYIDAGLARKTVNDNVHVVRRMFRWAVREELVPPSVHHGLSAVEGLRAGESQAPEPRKVNPVPVEHVEAVLPYLLRPVQALVRLQTLTGMRPGEVTIMRAADLDMSGSLWVYRPGFHKTEHYRAEKEIYLGPQAQEILRPFLRANLEEYLFRPDEAEAERDAERRRRRKSPLWASHLRRQRRKRKRSPKRTPRDHYSVDTYAQAVRRACARAGIPEWTPHRLRHSFGTRIRKEYGVEAARVMLGHQHVGVTEIYAERDLAVAATIATKHG